MNKAIRASISIGLAITTLGFITAASSYAAGTSNCQIVYGGGEVCESKIQFTIDKKVQAPNKGGEFVDNLTINDHRFIPGNNASFKIIVKNTGDATIEKLNVTDTLPAYLTFVSGPGNYNESNRTLSYTIDKLEKGKTHEQTFVVTIATADNLPANQGIVCITNEAMATDNKGTQAKDAASLCVQKETTGAKPTPQVFEKTPVKKIPETGPEMLPLLGLIPAGLAGIAMRRKSKLG